MTAAEVETIENPADLASVPLEAANSANLPERSRQAVEREIDRLFPARNLRRVLLVLPPDGSAELFDFAAARKRRYHNNPPYGLGVLAAVLRQDGIEVRILNLNNALLRAALGGEEGGRPAYDRIIGAHLEDAISSFAPDLIGISAMFSMAHDSSVDCCRRIRRVAPNMPIALGGVHFTNSFSSAVTRDVLLAGLDGADLIFMYEAELALRSFVRFVNRQANIADLAQVAFLRTSPALYLSNRAVPMGDELDLLPAFDLMDLDELSRHGNVGAMHFLVPEGTRIATSLSNRGCRAQCTFCSVRQFNGVGVRGRSIGAVVDELLVLRDDHGVQHVVWLDDDFLFDHRRALALFNEMVRRDVGLSWDWSNGVIAASCTEELIAAAAAAGCIGLFIGMESGNPHVLRQIKKPGNVRHFLQAAEVLRKFEQINTRVYLMFGFPGETFGMIADTIAVAREMDLDWNMIHPLQPLPNTPIYESVAEYRTFSELSFGRSDYSRKTAEALRAGDVLTVDFEDVFARNPADAMPQPEQFDAIWAYMFFHLNYERLFRETSPVKWRQALRYVERMATMVVPNSGFAWYFRNYLVQRIDGRIDERGEARLAELLAGHAVYRTRFAQLGMPAHPAGSVGKVRA